MLRSFTEHHEGVASLLEQARWRFREAEFMQDGLPPDSIIRHDLTGRYVRLATAMGSKTVLLHEVTRRGLEAWQGASEILVQSDGGEWSAPSLVDDLTFESYVARSDGAIYRMPPPPDVSPVIAALLQTNHGTGVVIEAVSEPILPVIEHLDLEDAVGLYALIADAEPVYFQTGHAIL